MPLLRFVEATAIDDDDPQAGIHLEVTARALNAVGVLHGGVVSTLLDVAAYLALVPELASDEEAITHALFVSYQQGAKTADRVVAVGRVRRRGRQLAFVDSELSRNGQLLAAAQVTKSILKRG